MGAAVDNAIEYAIAADVSNHAAPAVKYAVAGDVSNRDIKPEQDTHMKDVYSGNTVYGYRLNFDCHGETFHTLTSFNASNTAQPDYI